MDRQEVLEIQLREGRQAKETLELIRPWLDKCRQEVYSKLEDTDNKEETRLKYKLVAIKDIENGLQNAIKTSEMAKADLRKGGDPL